MVRSERLPQRGNLELPELLRRTETPEHRPLPYPGAAHLLPRSETPRVTPGDFFTAYLKISEGCNHRCAFCIIPRIRGPHESRPFADIIEEATRLAEGGVRELNLIAQDLTAYGRDLGSRSSLAELLVSLNEIKGLRWIRLLYCYPNFVTDELLDALANLPKVVKYIDMPLQHINDRMLKRMHRLGDRSAITSLVDRIRTRIPGVTFRTAFIVGFPGETEESIEEMKERLEPFRDAGVTRLVVPYVPVTEQVIGCVGHDRHQRRHHFSHHRHHVVAPLHHPVGRRSGARIRAAAEARKRSGQGAPDDLECRSQP